MLGNIFNNEKLILLNKCMDSSMLKNEVIANNIANINTPGYKRREVIFEDNMKKVLKNETAYDKLKITNINHSQISDGKSKLNKIVNVREMNGTSFRNDGNNVDIDVENAEMAKNKIYYDALTQSMNNEIKLLRMAISGR